MASRKTVLRECFTAPMRGEMAQQRRDFEVLAESFPTWVKISFVHMPVVADDAKQAARALAQARFKEFVEHVAQQYGRGKRFMDDVPRETDESNRFVAPRTPTGRTGDRDPSV